MTLDEKLEELKTMVKKIERDCRDAVINLRVEEQTLDEILACVRPRSE